MFTAASRERKGKVYAIDECFEPVGNFTGLEEHDSSILVETVELDIGHRVDEALKRVLEDCENAQIARVIETEGMGGAASYVRDKLLPFKLEQSGNRVNVHTINCGKKCTRKDALVELTPEEVEYYFLGGSLSDTVIESVTVAPVTEFDSFFRNDRHKGNVVEITGRGNIKRYLYLNDTEVLITDQADAEPIIVTKEHLVGNLIGDDYERAIKEGLHTGQDLYEVMARIQIKLKAHEGGFRPGEFEDPDAKMMQFGNTLGTSEFETVAAVNVKASKEVGRWLTIEETSPGWPSTTAQMVERGYVVQTEVGSLLSTKALTVIHYKHGKGLPDEPRTIFMPYDFEDPRLHGAYAGHLGKSHIEKIAAFCMLRSQMRGLWLSLETAGGQRFSEMKGRMMGSGLAEETSDGHYLAHAALQQLFEISGIVG